MSNRNLISESPVVVNLGVPLFAEDLFRNQLGDVIQVDWQPPAGGDSRLGEILGRLEKPGLATRISQANTVALERMNAAEPTLVDIQRFGDIYPELDKHTVLHAGPPLEWSDMCGPLRGAVTGALRFEGIATTDEEAEELAAGGHIRFRPNHEFSTVGPMTGITTVSMPVFVVRNETFGNTAYCTMNEGMGKVMRFGANDDSVLDRLRWIRDELAPSLKRTLSGGNSINLKSLLARALAMGDEMHQRNIAASALFARDVIPALLKSDITPHRAVAAAEFICGNEQWFLNLAMAAGKATSDPVRGIPYSTVVTAMARNGINFGIQISGLEGRWFEAPVELPEGLYFPGYSSSDANPDIGDSTIVESIGFGGMAMAAAPAVTRFVGLEDAVAAYRITSQMAEICIGRSNEFLVPGLSFRGVPTAIDIRAVVELGIRPVINTGIAHKSPGVGQIGAGIVRPPAGCFSKALTAFAEYYDSTENTHGTAPAKLDK